jgi:hypothetical protein
MIQQRVLTLISQVDHAVGWVKRLVCSGRRYDHRDGEALFQQMVVHCIPSVNSIDHNFGRETQSPVLVHLSVQKVRCANDLAWQHRYRVLLRLSVLLHGAQLWGYRLDFARQHALCALSSVLSDPGLDLCQYIAPCRGLSAALIHECVHFPGFLGGHRGDVRLCL